MMEAQESSEALHSYLSLSVGAHWQGVEGNEGVLAYLVHLLPEPMLRSYLSSEPSHLSDMHRLKPRPVPSAEYQEHPTCWAPVAVPDERRLVEQEPSDIHRTNLKDSIALVRS